jgi:restriction system protein
MMEIRMTDTDVSDLDIERPNIEMVSATQIVEFISRNELDLARLVEGILIAQGYRTRVSPFGDDGSIDIVADGRMGPLGFGLPRIAVLVKPGNEMADPDIDELEAFMALSGAAQGLFVSWIGFTDAARKEAGRLFHQSKFWDVTQVIVELVANYEKLSDGLKSELPLKRIWILGQKKPDRSARFAWQSGDVEIIHHGEERR